MADRPVMTDALRKEILLQVNQRLYEAGAISQTLYEGAKIRIVNGK